MYEQSAAPAADHRLEARLLGGCHILWDDLPFEVTKLKRTRSQRLLFLLLRNERRISWEDAYECLWGTGEASDLRKRKDLIVSLQKDLNRQFQATHTSGISPVRLVDDHLAFDPHIAVHDDAGAFENAAQAALHGGGIAALHAAAELYSGTLLPKLTADFVGQWRGRLVGRYVDVLEKLRDLGGPRTLIPFLPNLRQSVVDDPFGERGLRLLMAGLAAHGDRGGALRSFEAWTRRLAADDIGEPEPQTSRLYEELRGAGAPNNLPAQLSRFVGREGTRAHILRLLRSSDGDAEEGARVRLVTLVGMSGIGKTRLALAVATAARSLETVFPDGVWWVGLESLHGADAALVVEQVARALSVAEQPPTPLVSTVAHALRHRRLLLVLDNCEHVLPACVALVDTLLKGCPGVVVLATSRTLLHIGGEQLVPVEPLALETLADAAHDPAEAEALFLDRLGRLGLPTPTAGDRDTVRAICRQLEGIPLALELAAARVNTLGLADLQRRLADRFSVLRRGAADAPDRHRTLQAAMDWSYYLLTPDEQRLFRGLAVFFGGWTLDAAEAVCARDAPDSLLIVDLLEGLVAGSLVICLDGPEGSRYHALETVRDYADRQLDAAEKTLLGERHRRWCLGLVEQELGGQRAESGPRLDREAANLRAALRFSNRAPNGTAGDGDDARLAGALWRYWQFQGRLVEGRRRLEELADDADASPELRAEALNGAGSLAELAGETMAARKHHDASLTMFRKLQDRRGEAGALNNLAIVAYDEGRFGEALSLHRSSLAIRRELGDRRAVAASLNFLGRTLLVRGVPGRARVVLEESIRLYEQLTTSNWGLAVARCNLGHALSSCGTVDGAFAAYGLCLELSRELRHPLVLAECLDGVAGRWLTEEAPVIAARAAELLGAAATQRGLSNVGRPIVEQVGYQRFAAKVETAIGCLAYQSALTVGAALDFDGARALGLQAVRASVASPTRRPLRT